MEGLPLCISLIFGLITFLTVFTFWTAVGRNRSVQRADLHLLTVIHIVRAPAAVSVYGLFIFGIIPGRTAFGIANHEIFAGLSAPVIYYFCVMKGVIKRRPLLVWNVICLCFSMDILFKVVSAGTVSSSLMPHLFPVVLVTAIACSHFVSLRILLSDVIEKKSWIGSFVRINVLNVILLSAFLLSSFSKGGERRQPYPQSGFWTTETTAGTGITKVRYYSSPDHLLREQIVQKEIDITKLSVRKELNRTLAEIIARDSVTSKLPKLYESN